MTNRVMTLCGLGTALMIGSAASADFSAIGAPFGFELSHGEIIESIYGGSFSKSGLDYTNGTVSAIRVDDSLTPNGVMDLFGGSAGSAADQVWSGSEVTATAKARFAGKTQAFGYHDLSDDSYHPLFDVDGTGLDVTGSATIDLTGVSFGWGRTDVGGASPFSSVLDDNVDLVDHMVSYQITGLEDGKTTWLLFWEDIAKLDGRIPDFDYNDLVVEVAAVPAPPALAALLGGLALGRRRRRQAS